MKLVVFFLLLSHLADARDWQVWVFIGQSLMNGPVGDVSDLSDSSHDGEILQYVRGLDSNRIQTVSDVHDSRGRVGPAEVFARQMWTYGERDIVIIKISPGGYSIAAFLDEERRLEPKKSNNADLWPYWVDLVAGKLEYLESSGSSATLRGVVMFQGSSDRNSTFINVYEEHLSRLIADTREYLESPDLRWMQIVSPTWSSANSINMRLQSIQRSVASSIENADFVESDAPLGIPLVFTDGTHPDLASSERIGIVTANHWVDVFPTYMNHSNKYAVSLLEYMTTLADMNPTVIVGTDPLVVEAPIRTNDALGLFVKGEFSHDLQEWIEIDGLITSELDSGFSKFRYDAPVSLKKHNAQFFRFNVDVSNY
jgi:hypothetical protein